MFLELFKGAAALKLIQLMRGNRLMAPAGNLGLSRQQMPQIDSKYLDQLVQWLATQEVGVDEKQWGLDKLKLVQAEYNREKVLSLIDTWGKKPSPPILVSNDGYVLDGSHRFLAKFNRKKETGDGQRIKTLTVDLPARAAVDALRRFPGVQFRNYSDKSLAK
ncbi:hypothetical protein [Delftia phage PhiW-14]|uniref:ParB/Sulfiredoxin domain-containing protein n=1 Tax=Delftia phage PhiW-14 TaxID=665032 RepID=C9DG46_BPW14|nr:hypothetical protein DP-phiW-14_gp075 [Delftia phage PhiW-14]ACV50097.1 hypothetical protein [Delftia phage PhiW-14]